MKVVKRKGELNKFDERKVYASCYAASLAADIPKKEAEKICNKVCKTIKKWMKDKDVVTSTQIFKEAAKEMKKHNKDAAFMYRTHREIF